MEGRIYTQLVEERPEQPSGLLARYLSRRTSGRKVIPEIDGLRSVAIVSVLLFHAAWTFRENLGKQAGGPSAVIDAVLDTGEYGVPVFFVISGFILALPFASAMTGGPRISLVKYVKRRLTRLEPPYFVALLVAFTVLAIQTGTLEKLPNLLASAFYVHSFVYGERSHVLPVSWSLEVEVQFYLMMPALAFVYAIRRTALRRGLMVAGIAAISAVFGQETPIWGRTVVHQGGYFLAGMLLADLYRTGWLGLGEEVKEQWMSVRALPWDALALLCLTGTFAVKGLDWMPAQTAPWLILIGFVAVFRGGLVRRFFRWTPIVTLGGMCYTIYLWHFLVMRAAWPMWADAVAPQPTTGHLVLFVVVASVATLALSTVLFVLIERPTMDPEWPRKLAAAIKNVSNFAKRSHASSAAL